MVRQVTGMSRNGRRSSYNIIVGMHGTVDAAGVASQRLQVSTEARQSLAVQSVVIHQSGVILSPGRGQQHNAKTRIKHGGMHRRDEPTTYPHLAPPRRTMCVRTFTRRGHHGQHRRTSACNRRKLPPCPLRRRHDDGTRGHHHGGRGTHHPLVAHHRHHRIQRVGRPGGRASCGSGAQSRRGG